MSPHATPEKQRVAPRLEGVRRNVQPPVYAAVKYNLNCMGRVLTGLLTQQAAPGRDGENRGCRFDKVCDSRR